MARMKPFTKIGIVYERIDNARRIIVMQKGSHSWIALGKH